MIKHPETSRCPWCNTDTVVGYEKEHLTDACLDVPPNLKETIWRDWRQSLMMGRP